MSDVLSGLGLEPAPADDPSAPAPDPAPEPTSEPDAPAAPAEPTPEPPAADEPIVVPEGAENPDAVRNLIQEERRRAREAYAKAKQLERELEARSEAAKPLEQRLKEASDRAAAAELKSLRLEVGIAHGLSQDLAGRLKGSSKEEMEQDAQSFLSALTTAAAPHAGVTLNGGPQTPPPAAPVDPAKAHGAFLTGLLSAQQ